MSNAFAPQPPSYRPLSIASGVSAAAGRTPDKTALREGERSLDPRGLMNPGALPPV